MPRRRPPRRGDDAASPPRSAPQRRDDWRGESYDVRPVAGARAGKPYRCPGCDQVVGAGTAHLVVWRTDDIDADDRRHWHSACWAARDRRSPTRRWS